MVSGGMEKVEVDIAKQYYLLSTVELDGGLYILLSCILCQCKTKMKFRLLL